MTPLPPVSAVARKVLRVRTGGREFSEISRQLGEVVAGSVVQAGLVNIY